jgi:hypothetical protein
LRLLLPLPALTLLHGFARIHRLALLQGLALLRTFALLRSLALLLPFAYLAVAIRSHTIGDRARFENG